MVSAYLDEGEGGPEAKTPRLTVTDHEGRFRITNLNPGSWEVAVMKRLLDQDPLGLGEVVRLGPLGSAGVEVWNEETSVVEINLGAKEKGPCGTVSGRVLVNGTAAHGARVSIWSRNRFEATVDRTGRYDLGEIPVGERWITVTNIPGPTGRYESHVRRDVVVEENLPLDVDFEISTGALAGKVLYENDGRAVQGVNVLAQIEKESSPYNIRMSTVTGLDGTFIFEGAPVGTYTVKARDRRLGCRPSTGIKVTSRAKTGPIMLWLIETVLVEGRVELPEEAKGSRWVGLTFEAVDRADNEKNGGREWTNVDVETGDFKISKLIPGKYKVKLIGPMPDQLKPIEIDVPPGGLDNVVLIFEKQESDE